MGNPLLLPELRELLAEADDASLKLANEMVSEWHPASVSELSEDLNVEETWKLLSYGPLARQSEIFSFYPPAKQEAMVTGGGRERVSKLLEVMSHDDRVDLLRRLGEDVVDSLLPLVAKADREDIKRLLSYPEHSAGSMMTTDYASLPADVTVKEALSLLRQQAPSTETIYYIYVLDSERRLLGFISLRDLILAKPSALVRDVMQTDVILAVVNQDREAVVQEISKYDFLAIPVVDDQKRLVGIITYDDAIDVVTEEATEDVQKLGGVTPIEENYIEAPFALVWRRRSMWLATLFVAELTTFTAMASFEETMKQVSVVLLFLPLCISTGGNSGSQAATLITRAMALGQIGLGDWWRVLRHELLMGLALGATLGAVGFLRAILTSEGDRKGVDAFSLALTLSQAVAAICLWGTVVGSMLPLMFKKFGIDPGYASSPFVATFVDVTGIVILFSLANVYLL